MPRRFVDLSIYLENDVISDPPPFGPKIQYHKHEETAGQIAGFFPGLKKEDLPDGQGWAVENVNLSTHNGTHLDAPWHFHPTMNNGERAITIDEVPLEWCFSDGVKLDFRSKPDGYVCTADDVKRELDRIGYKLKPLVRVILNSHTYQLASDSPEQSPFAADPDRYFVKANVRMLADRKSTRLNSSHIPLSRMPSSA